MDVEGEQQGMPQGLQIGTLAQQTGLTVDAIRFYEKSGLLKRPARTQGGFRLFRREDALDLRFIQLAQELGFSLQEIRELLILQREDVEACSHVDDLLDQKLADVRGKIAELEKLKRSLESASRKCKQELKKAGVAHRGCCPVLEELSQTKQEK
jgi:DNA-binding transcriptional MerR regulator